MTRKSLISAFALAAALNITPSGAAALTIDDTGFGFRYSIGVNNDGGNISEAEDISAETVDAAVSGSRTGNDGRGVEFVVDTAARVRGDLGAGLLEARTGVPGRRSSGRALIEFQEKFFFDPSSTDPDDVVTLRLIAEVANDVDGIQSSPFSTPSIFTTISLNSDIRTATSGSLGARTNLRGTQPPEFTERQRSGAWDVFSPSLYDGVIVFPASIFSEVTLTSSLSPNGAASARMRISVDASAPFRSASGVFGTGETVAPVPLPPAVAPFAAALAGLFAFRRRVRRAA